MGKIIGIDLGGTKILGGLIDFKGNVLKSVQVNTESDKGKEKVLGNIKLVINRLIEKDNICDIIGIGLGSPGFINVDEGVVVYSGGNISGWNNINVSKELQKYFDIPIFIENDANLAALCEGWVGAAKRYDNFLMITLGTGVGGAIYTKNEGLWHGANWQGAEFGHSILYAGGRQCNCGQKGCAEQYISGRALEKIYFEKTGENLKGKDIFINAANGDEVSKAVVDKYIKNLSAFIISLKNIFYPQALVIGGGVINSKDYWWDKLIYRYNKECNRNEGMDILPAQYQNDAGMIGAGKMVLDRLDISKIDM